MIKTLVFSSTLLFLLCGPALADPTPRPVTSFDLDLAISSGPQVRRFGLKVVDGTCASVTLKDSGTSEDSIGVCIRDPSQLVVEIDWLTRDGQRELHNKSVLLAKRGGTFELDGSGAKLTVTVR